MHTVVVQLVFFPEYLPCGNIQVLPKDVYLGDALEVEPTPASLTRSGSLMASLFPRSSKDLTTRTDNGPKRFMPFSEGGQQQG